jgi:arsenate reductase
MVENEAPGKYKVLFICVHNSARSQMAEAFLNHLHGDLFEAYSAGYEPGNMNPLAVEVMKEVGIDMSQQKPKNIFDLVRAGMIFSYAITLCVEAEEGCPIFPGITTRLHWNFPDPSNLTGSREDQLEKVRNIRNAIRSSIEQWVKQFRASQQT